SLDGSDTPCLILDDWLIDELKLITPDSLAKIVLQRIATVSLGLEFFVVDAEAAATFILRLVEREIGVLQDFVATIPMPRRARNANTESDGARLSLDLIRRAQDVDQPARQLLGSFSFRLASEQDEQGKLVAAETGRNVDFTDGRLDAGRHLPEKDVAGMMAIGIVHTLEVVEIELENGEFVADASQPRQALLDFFSKQAPVGQIRERIIESEALDLSLRVLPLGDVIDERNQILRFLVAVSHDGPADRDD